jgi:hypothetical protein
VSKRTQSLEEAVERSANDNSIIKKCSKQLWRRQILGRVAEWTHQYYSLQDQNPLKQKQYKRIRFWSAVSLGTLNGQGLRDIVQGFNLPVEPEEIIRRHEYYLTLPCAIVYAVGALAGETIIEYLNTNTSFNYQPDWTSKGLWVLAAKAGGSALVRLGFLRLGVGLPAPSGAGALTNAAHLVYRKSEMINRVRKNLLEIKGYVLDWGSEYYWKGIESVVKANHAIYERLSGFVKKAGLQ